MIDDLRKARLDKARYLESKGINPYPPEPPTRTNFNAEVTINFGQLEGTDVSLVGRVVNIRKHGKVAFFDLRDDSGSVQIFLSEADNPAQFYTFSRGYDIGDFIAVSGSVFKTRSEQPSVRVTELTMLAKSLLQPMFPPEYRERRLVGTETQAEIDRRDIDVKNGVIPPDVLLNPDTRSQQRYLDMLAHREIIERFKLRSNMIEFMRQEFRQRDCWEVETPIVDTQYGGASARPFTTHHNARDLELYLRISNELYLKKYMVGGLEGVFEFSRDFRNEGEDWKHNPEFTQVELYKAYADYRYMMDMSEKLMSDIAQQYLHTTTLNYQGHEINLAAPWRRLSVYEGILEKTGYDFDKLSTDEILQIAKNEDIYEADPGYIAMELFGRYVEPTLIQPTFVIDYPQSTSPLTKLHRCKPGLVERFECYVAGMEVMNCYTELNDPRLQRANFEAEESRKSAGDQEAMNTDDDFITAMEYGMPPMGGIGISIDRWMMLYSNSNHIREVIAFPIQRPRR